MQLQSLSGRGEDLAYIKKLLAKPFWTTGEYQLLKDFMRITHEEEEEVLARVDLEVLLAGLGYHFPGRATHPQIKCFLHPDDTPSLTLYRIGSRSRFPNTCYCFGCHRYLNPISVMIELYGQSYPDAMDYLLGTCLGSPRQLLRRQVMARFKNHQSRNGNEKGEIEPPKLQTSPVITLPSGENLADVLKEVGQINSKKSNPYQGNPLVEPGNPHVKAILEAAITFYHLQLKTFPQGLGYLAKRGLSPRTIEEARLGYSRGEGLSHWLKDHSLNLDIAREIGLLYHGNQECLAGRIVLPSLPINPHYRVSRPVEFLTGRLLAEAAGRAGLFNGALGFPSYTNLVSSQKVGGFKNSRKLFR